eukprot:5934703-Pleurochrysis_carterae.AAC.1
MGPAKLRWSGVTARAGKQSQRNPHVRTHAGKPLHNLPPHTTAPTHTHNHSARRPAHYSCASTLHLQ